MTISASFTKARAFLRTLQRAPEPVRRRWQRAISATVFMVVIAGWIFYLNISLSPAAAPVETELHEGGFFETLEKGFSVLGSSLSEEWSNLQEFGGSVLGVFDANISNPSVFTFVREEAPFIPSPYEPTSSATLPVSQ